MGGECMCLHLLLQKQYQHYYLKHKITFNELHIISTLPTPLGKQRATTHQPSTASLHSQFEYFVYLSVPNQRWEKAVKLNVARTQKSNVKIMTIADIEKLYKTEVRGRNKVMTKW